MWLVFYNEHQNAIIELSAIHTHARDFKVNLRSCGKAGKRAQSHLSTENLKSILVCIHRLLMFTGSCGNPDAKRLYDDLLSNYNKLVRPVVNVSDAVEVKLKLKLSQLIDVVSVTKCF